LAVGSGFGLEGQSENPLSPIETMIAAAAALVARRRMTTTGQA
jgi:hypothetical protein